MERITDQQLSSFINASHRIAKMDLQRCSSGNMSLRLDDNLIALTATGSWMGEITENQIALCRLDDGTSINGIKPSVESIFHRGILQNRPDINVVLHFQSPYATAIAAGNPHTYDFSVIAEIPIHTGTPAIVEYIMPGSPELADAVIAALIDSDLAILRNHGQVTVGKDFNDAIEKAYFFELACQILLTQKNTRPIPKEKSDALIQYLNKKSAKQ